LLAPLVRGLARMGVTPNLVSLLGMLMLAPFAYLVLAYDEPWIVALACGFILLHVALDGLDGPLARYCGQSGQAGALVDICCDHGGLVIVVWVTSAAGLIDGTIGSIYVVLYTVAVVFIIWLNALGRPLRYVFRSKYVFYALLLLYGLTGLTHILTPALAVFSVYNLLLCGYAFLRIRQALALIDSRGAS
jgi:phosphatidylglycerophosphate synthase